MTDSESETLISYSCLILTMPYLMPYLIPYFVYFTFSLLTPFQLPTLPIISCPRALILSRLWRYINHVLTYLLTYLA